MANLHSGISQSQASEWKVLQRNRETGAQEDQKFQFVEVVALGGRRIEASIRIIGGQNKWDGTMESVELCSRNHLFRLPVRFNDFTTRFSEVVLPVLLCPRRTKNSSIKRRADRQRLVTSRRSGAGLMTVHEQVMPDPRSELCESCKKRTACSVSSDRMSVGKH